MDNLEYLQHISQSNRPVAPVKKSKISIALIGKILLGGIVATALIIGVSVLLTNKSNKSEDLTQQLYLRINNINKTVTDNTRLLKSSQLRSISVSLSGTLTNTATQLSNYAAAHNEDGKKDPLAPKTAILEVETTSINTLNTVLSNAKLNGLLDRTYAVQIHLQVSLLLSITSELINRSSDEPDLLQILNQFQSSLSVIEQNLDNYSNPSD